MSLDSDNSKNSPQSKIHKKWVMVFPILATTVLTLFIFQNCADPLELADEASLSFADSLPFAFDTTLDHISYMSCSKVPGDYDPRGFYSFKAGAYDKGGIKISNDYLSETGGYKGSQRLTFIGESEASQAAQLQLSVRRRTNYQGPLTVDGTPTIERDYDIVEAPLDSTVIINALAELSPGERLNYFSGGSGLGGRQVEFALRFLDTEELASDVRSKLINSTLLTLTYTDHRADDETVARAPEVFSEEKVFGRGYEVDFKLDSRSSPGVRRSLSRINEIDLLTRRTVAANWECPNSMSFMIVRPEDLHVGEGAAPEGKAVCNLAVETGPPVAEYYDAWKAIRNVLRPEDWYVDLANRCVVPRRDGQCYGKEEITIKYAGACDPDPTTGNCPHFVSVCTRVIGD